KSHTREEVGASSAYPSAETHSTSSTPCRAAHRWEAMFTAYERDFTPPSSHGAAGRVAAARPRVAVTAAAPSRRMARTAGPTGDSVAKTVTGPYAAPGSGSAPRVQTSRRAPSCARGQA